MNLDDIRARDAALHYCATCGNRVYDPDDPTNPHNYTVEECEETLEEKGKRKPAPPDDYPRGYGPKRLCWSPKDHHPFVEGEIPDYEQAEADRRWLLKAYDRLVLDYLGETGAYPPVYEADWQAITKDGLKQLDEDGPDIRRMFKDFMENRPEINAAVEAWRAPVQGLPPTDKRGV